MKSVSRVCKTWHELVKNKHFTYYQFCFWQKRLPPELSKQTLKQLIQSRFGEHCSLFDLDRFAGTKSASLDNIPGESAVERFLRMLLLSPIDQKRSMIRTLFPIRGRPDSFANVAKSDRLELLHLIFCYLKFSCGKTCLL